MRISLMILSVLMFTAAASNAADWPQFRGPDRTGISKETDWKKDWSGRPDQLWKKNVGVGASTVSVADGRLYTMGNIDDTDVVWCLDAKTGKEIWKHTYSCKLDKRQFEGGTAATPTVHQGKVYTLSHEGHLFCLDAAKGDVLWSKHLVKDFGGERPRWGYACSPLIVGEKLIVDAGSKSKGTTLALNKDSGALIWGSSNRDDASYASHIVIEYKDRDAVVGMSGKHVNILDLKTGRELARMPWETSYDVNASTPIIVDDKHLFISSGYSTGGGLVDLSGSKPREVWHSRDIKNKFSTAVLHEGYLYGIDNRDLTCLNVKTGETMWTVKRQIGEGNVLLADDHLIVLADHGEVMVAPASPKGFKPISRAQVVRRRAWVVPVLSHGVLYCRNNQGDLVALDIRKQAG